MRQGVSRDWFLAEQPTRLTQIKPVISGTLLTVDETARRLRLHPDTVYRMVSRSEILSRRVGRLIRIPEAALEAFLNG